MRSLKIETKVTMAWDERDTLTPELIEITAEQIRIYQEAVEREAIKHQHQNPQWRQGTLVGIQSGLLHHAKTELESAGKVRVPFSYNFMLDILWDGEKAFRQITFNRHDMKERFERQFVHAVDRLLGATLLAELGQNQLIELLPDGWVKSGLPGMKKADVLKLSKSELSARMAAITAPRIIERPSMISAIHPMHWDPPTQKVFYPLEITIPCLSDGTFPSKPLKFWTEAQKQKWGRIYSELSEPLSRERRRSDHGYLDVDWSFAERIVGLSKRFGEILENQRAVKRVKAMPPIDRAKHNLIRLEAAEVTPGLDPKEKARIFHAAETAANYEFHRMANQLNQPGFGSFGYRAMTSQAAESVTATPRFVFSDGFHTVETEGEKYEVNDRQAAFLRELDALPRGESKHFSEIFEAIGLADDQQITSPYKLFQRGGKDGRAVYDRLIKSRNGRYSLDR